MSTTTEEEDESWEVKAFEQDTGNVMGTTWPPRSYTCTFCRREFRSAQALGGHMNVHRRDRARLHQAQPNFKNPNISSSNTNNTLLIPHVAAAAAADTTTGLCLLFSLPKQPNAAAIFNPSSLNNVVNATPSHIHHSITSHPNNLMNFPGLMPPHQRRLNNYSEASKSIDHRSNLQQRDQIKKTDLDLAVEATIDLELRLGCSSSVS
ncbi:hypothetical protein QVD17_04255 [Tagetes erecta]|uniref:C2H2-type domain-containing protein n=1 Tax=Tagetes erecta TaxID=13708 RepID=A0AAD8LGB6_TARER|nr:hypothetical protein QVD17_04255 [Tagetes erecta]